MVLFADDSTVIFVGDKNIPPEPEINMTLHDIIQWLTCNNLAINLEKTNIMTFYKYKKLTSKISYNGNDIENISDTKFLGLYVDCDLNWKRHAKELCSKLSRFSYALFMLAKVVDKQFVLTAYHAYVTSALRYGIIFWGNCSERLTIFRAQKKCIRSVCHLKPRDSCKAYFPKLNVLPFPCLYIFETALFVKNNIHMFRLQSSTRHRNRIRVPQRRTALYSKSVLGMGPSIYNHLPKTIVNSENFVIFKRKLFEFLIKKCYYNLKSFFEDDISNL